MPEIFALLQIKKLDQKSDSGSSQKNLRISPSPEEEAPRSALVKAPRSSWPSEMHGTISFSRSLSVLSDHNAEESLEMDDNEPFKTEGKPKVVEMFKSLIRSKNDFKVKDLTNNKNEAIAEEAQNTKRKFSLTRCLAQKHKISHKDIVIDVNPTSSEDLRELNVFRATRIMQEDKKKLKHQTSNPVMPSRGRIKGSPRFPHRIVPTSSLTMLAGGALTETKTKETETSLFSKEAETSEDSSRNVIFHQAEVSASQDANNK